jgi:acyl-CoA thioesterase FadM
LIKQFKQQIPIRFRQADPAGILFFGNVPGIAHDCFEDFLQEAGFSYKDWFESDQFIVPIRHLECNFHAAFLPGKTHWIQATVAQIKDTSFQMKYVFSTELGVCAEVTMVHAFLDKKSKKKISVPEIVRSRLEKYLI